MTWKFPGYEVDAPIDWSELESRYSWFRDMQGIPQDAIWHAEGDVYTHTKMVVEALTALPEFSALDEQAKHVLFAAAMFHDVEKRSCTAEEEIEGVVRIVSPRHAKKGEYTARAILYKDLECPFELREHIAKLVRLHGQPLWAIGKEDPGKSVVEGSLSVNTEFLAMLARADVLGRICEDQEDLLLQIELFKEQCREMDCLGQARRFASDYARYCYLNKEGSWVDREPHDAREFEVFLMCGLPGSGKDTYIRENLDLPMLSLDDIRRQHKIAPDDKKGTGRVVQMAKEQARVYLRAKQSFVFNATNITANIRGKWLSLFSDYKAKLRIIYIEVPYAQLFNQNKNREHVVPADVIEGLIQKMEIPSYLEADEITWVVGSES